MRATNGYFTKNNGLHAEIQIDPSSHVGKDDPRHQRCLDGSRSYHHLKTVKTPVAAVDAEEKVEVYRNWFGFDERRPARQSFEKWQPYHYMNPDREYTAPDGGKATLARPFSDADS